MSISFICPLLGLENPLTIVQVLWVNLVMDCLAALAFGGEPALDRYMEEAPKKRDEKIISPYMVSAIGTSGLWCFAISLIFLLTDFSRSHFRDVNPEGVTITFGGDSVYVLTAYFAAFIFLAVFNAFNTRTDRVNLFENIGANPGFLRVMALIVVVQVIMTYFGGAILRCYGLTASEWAFVIAMAFTIIPVDIVRKLIVGGSK